MLPVEDPRETRHCWLGQSHLLLGNRGGAKMASTPGKNGGNYLPSQVHAEARALHRSVVVSKRNSPFLNKGNCCSTAMMSE